MVSRLRSQIPLRDFLMVMVRLTLLFGALYWGAEAYHSWTGGSNEAGFNAMIMLMILADWFFAARRKRKAS